MDFRESFSILIVDDEKSLLDNLYQFLEAKGFKKVYTTKNLEESKSRLESFKIDLIALDPMLPDDSGFDFLREVRQTPGLVVIILSVLDGIDDQGEGFENKADGYLVKPFSPDGFLWRVNTVLRESKKIRTQEKISLGPMVFNKPGGVLEGNSQEIALTAKQLKILDYLCRNINQIASIDRILNNVWEDFYGYENTSITHIYRLQEKLKDDPGDPKILITIKGLGHELIKEG